MALPRGQQSSAGEDDVMNDPFKIIEPTCISFSGGRTSAYLLWRVLESNNGLPEEAVVCFANTGKEDEATLQFVKDCQDNWGVPITWLEYQIEDPGYKVVTFETASRNGEPFEGLIKKKYAIFCAEYLPSLPDYKNESDFLKANFAQCRLAVFLHLECWMKRQLQHF